MDLSVHLFALQHKKTHRFLDLSSDKPKIKSKTRVISLHSFLVVHDLYLMLEVLFIRRLDQWSVFILCEYIMRGSWGTFCHNIYICDLYRLYHFYFVCGLFPGYPLNYDQSDPDRVYIRNFNLLDPVLYPGSQFTIILVVRIAATDFIE